MKKSLTRAERVKHQADFDRVFSNGSRSNGSGSRLVYLSNGLGYNRFAVCPVRKYGTAVERNRAKRVCREAYRSLKNLLEPGFDLIMVIKPGSDSFAERSRQFMELCTRARLLSTVPNASS